MEMEASHPCGASSSTSASHDDDNDPTLWFLGPLRSHRAWVHACIQDLNNYLAVGSVILPLEDTTVPSHWHEVSALPSDTDAPSTLRDDLQILAMDNWVRLFLCGFTDATTGIPFCVLRTYVLADDVGLRFIDRSSKKLRQRLLDVVQYLCTSAETWEGEQSCMKQPFDAWATADEGSLFHIFNSIPSPSPSKDAIDQLSESFLSSRGMVTSLYPYQRRSAALMFERETQPSTQLDPRLEERSGPDGTKYFYGARDTLFLRSPRMYESCQGGILAETMGLGKTLICISLILATKGYLPRIPAQYDRIPHRTRCSSLLETAISATKRHYVPWKAHFEDLDMAPHCVDLLKNDPPTYEIPQEPRRWNRGTALPPPKKLTLASTTIIVVPRNLCAQWQSELEKHTERGRLSILVMEDVKKPLPGPDELRQYDVLLFSRSRFEQEIRDGSDGAGRRFSHAPVSCQCPYIGATRTRDCTCLHEDSIYDSALKHLHFHRIIIDEGHFFSSQNSVAAQVASKLVVADHRWVVSGTPARDLLGIEMELDVESHEQRQDLMNLRSRFSQKDDISGAITSLGSLTTHYLKVRPWATGDGERAASWEQYVFRHEDPKKRTFDGYSKCLRQTLESLVIKTQQSDVERDILLPPLTHNIVRLEPSVYDKITSNLFTLVLTANAITSERTDADYLFHRNSQKERLELIRNLRQSAFFWTGFSEGDVKAAIDHGAAYLEKPKTMCAPDDRMLLSQCMSEAGKVLEVKGWKALSSTHELGLFVDRFPEQYTEHWSFASDSYPTLMGATQLLEAQNFINGRAQAEDPTEGFSGAGIHALRSLRTASAQGGDNPVLLKLGIPSSGVSGEHDRLLAGRRRSISQRNSMVMPRVSKKDREAKARLKQTEERAFAEPLSERAHAGHPIAGVQIETRDPSSCIAVAVNTDLPVDSPLRHTSINGTTSSKMSYLASQILKHYRSEKILIFYEGDNVAYYVAQVLEILHVPHLIYARSLTPARKSEYVVSFDQGDHFRVLLMDVQQAAWGLNLSSASRVFFVNPVCRPRIEAQAIKRAHRIGQTKPVVVETLVLIDSLEEKMFERSRSMTRKEHQDAKALEDDGGIREIIQSARPLPTSMDELRGSGRIARLEEEQQLWSRPGWSTWSPAAQTASNKRKGAQDQQQQHLEQNAVVEDSPTKGHQALGQPKKRTTSPPPAMDLKNHYKTKKTAQPKQATLADTPPAKRPRMTDRVDLTDSVMDVTVNDTGEDSDMRRSREVSRYSSSYDDGASMLCDGSQTFARRTSLFGRGPSPER